MKTTLKVVLLLVFCIALTLTIGCNKENKEKVTGTYVPPPQQDDYISLTEVILNPANLDSERYEIRMVFFSCDDLANIIKHITSPYRMSVTIFFLVTLEVVDTYTGDYIRIDQIDGSPEIPHFNLIGRQPDNDITINESYFQPPVPLPKYAQKMSEFVVQLMENFNPRTLEGDFSITYKGLTTSEHFVFSLD